ncbi:two pore domain potassium channel family protein, partial [Xanthomonas citri pv. citri]|nr:two pore domain potassium channel family protein [Xanthomonas citri pv. citri]
SHAANWFAWALAVPAMLLAVAAIALGQPALATASAVLESLLYFYAAGALIVYMLEDHTVTADELFAAAAAFTLLAWGFA